MVLSGCFERLAQVLEGPPCPHRPGVPLALISFTRVRAADAFDNGRVWPFMRALCIGKAEGNTDINFLSFMA